MSSTQLFEEKEHTNKYRLYRPGYPKQVFDHIIDYYFDGKTTNEKIPFALDVACGSGQATITLSSFCDRIIGIDVSANQIAHAIPKDNIEYRCNQAEDLTFLPTDSVDLITVATAFHWLDIPAFFTEVQRVLKPNRGVLAIWTYGPGSSDNPRADAIYHEFDQITLSQYWHKGKWLVDDFYRSLVPLFPYQSTLKTYSIEQRSEITIKQFVDVVETYSACQTFKKQEGEEAYKNLIETFRKKLLDCFQTEDADQTRVMMSNPIQLYLMKKQ